MLNAQFVIRLGGWEKDRQGRKLLSIASEIKQMRHELVECNLPLAISEARSFFKKNPQSHLSYMDFNQISALGLVEAVEKYCRKCGAPVIVACPSCPARLLGSYEGVVSSRSTVDKFCTGLAAGAFPVVCIGRMKGNLIDENSQTFIHFYPTERKTLYRLRKLLRTMPIEGEVDYGKLHSLLNDKESSSKDKLTSFSDMLNVLSASHVISGNHAPHDEHNEGSDIERFADTAQSRPYVQVEEADGRHAVGRAIGRLPMVDRKLMRMRGIDL